MKNIFFVTVLFAALIAFSLSADASVFRGGDINENYSYENLELEEKGKNKKRCYLRGTIINNSGEQKKKVRIIFHALNIHGELLWKLKVNISKIDQYGKFEFRKKISAKKCDEQKPDRWRFEVKEPKKKVIESSGKSFLWGEINENYSYKDLKFERVKKGRKTKCYLKGSIINRTDERKEDVKITFYALTLHDKALWKTTIKVDVIDRYENFDFEKKLKRCRKEDPYKWEFKVKEPKKRKKK